MDILKYLDSLSKPGALTVFRAIRCPTPERIEAIVGAVGASLLNFEQARLIALYSAKEYIQKRTVVQSDPLLAFQIQERIVPGLPVFMGPNDAIQIHRPFRLRPVDLVALCVMFIPVNLVHNGQVSLIANPPFAGAADDESLDLKVRVSVASRRGGIDLRWSALRGGEIYECYLVGVPLSRQGTEAAGIHTRVFLLDIVQILTDRDQMTINGRSFENENNPETVRALSGFWGGASHFSRPCSDYLPFRCREVMIGPADSNKL
ncbi:MAG: hypothetical protein KJ638_14005 [Chloroflexi bacterium]|nr:hypothetical protein [Chloroflexota bacterium]